MNDKLKVWNIIIPFHKCDWFGRDEKKGFRCLRIYPDIECCKDNCEIGEPNQEEKDIIINRLRVLINHLTFMGDGNQGVAVGKANAMLDEHFKNGGRFMETDLEGWLKE